MSEDRPEYQVGTFGGFETPKQNYSKMPHSLIDSLPLIKTVSELKVILYILRHTWGYSEFGKPKKITLDEMCDGRKRRDGTRMDNGTGLSPNSIRSGASDAVEHGFLLVEKDESDKARVETYYCLNILGVQSLNPGAQSLSPDVQSLSIVQRKKLEKETEEKDQESYDRKNGIEEAKKRKARADAAKAARDPIAEWGKLAGDKEQKYREMEDRVHKSTGLTVSDIWYRDKVMDFLLRKDEAGESIERFAQACKEDPYRMPKFFQIAQKPGLLKDTWGLAFVRDDPAGETEPVDPEKLERLRKHAQEKYANWKD